MITNCGADEDRDLTEQDRLRLVHVAGRSQDEEQGVAVALELRTLMRLDGILDRQLVQLELARDGGELVLARLVEPEPGDRVPALAGGVQLGEVVGLRRTTAVAVDGAVDDHARNAIPSSRRRTFSGRQDLRLGNPVSLEPANGDVEQGASRMIECVRA